MMKKILLLALFPLFGFAQNVESISLDQALKKLSAADGPEFTLAMKKDNMRLLLYAPKKTDKQEPHEADEVYIIISGTGSFSDGEKLFPFKPLDVIYVKAGQEHRFVDFSEDFKTWVVFY